MLKLEGIASFVATAQEGSMSAAARRLQLSKSVISERLADLESTLGAPLFHRTTRKLSLTEDGAAFLERALRILREVDEAAAELGERRGRLTGPMRLSAGVAFGRLHLGPALYPFLRKHPGISLTLELDDRQVDASAEGFDAVIRHGAIADSRLVAWTLASSRRCLVASPAYLRRQGRPKSLDDLGRHRAVYYLNRGAADWRFEDVRSDAFQRPPAALRVNNGDMMLDATLAGLGLALLPTFIAGPALAAGSLVEVQIGEAAAPESIYVAHPEGRRASAKLRALVDCLRKSFGNPPYWEKSGETGPAPLRP
ncbi:LysR family transcriptional regulator [Aquincola sp. J276]|uniref:LysR family transcriptional regulator n=1 Tax=Aquincola sp. J276 TaxID=2898432 RepID=UPI002150D2AA|nr:LysR family transcriptional regulator [Aquincola sp. J276]MCR5867735.1 LysR family transcriptional regulator [Aquincola sp. J276]